MNKNIGRLEISMNNSTMMKILRSINDVLKILFRFMFRNSFLLSEQFENISILTKFCNNVHVICSLIDIEEMHDILMGYFFHDLYFRLNVFDVISVGEDLFVDDLDSYRMGSFYLPSKIDRSV